MLSFSLATTLILSLIDRGTLYQYINTGKVMFNKKGVILYLTKKSDNEDPIIKTKPIRSHS